MTATVSEAYLPNSGNAYTRRYNGLRTQSERLAARLSPEDQQVQSMPDASPTKWHLGHTTWFFETFILRPQLPDYRVFDSTFNYLFNSYYEAVGPRSSPWPDLRLISRVPPRMWRSPASRHCWESH